MISCEGDDNVRRTRDGGPDNNALRFFDTCNIHTGILAPAIYFAAYPYLILGVIGFAFEGIGCSLNGHGAGAVAHHGRAS